MRLYEKDMVVKGEEKEKLRLERLQKKKEQSLPNGGAEVPKKNKNLVKY
jgi:hypothetical protein